MNPTILWFRRDLRLQDHEALTAAVTRGGPILAVFICDEQVENLGAAPKWRLGASVAALQAALLTKGNRLILRRGFALPTLKALVAETGAKAVYWQRAYDPTSQSRDRAVKAAFEDGSMDDLIGRTISADGATHDWSFSAIDARNPGGILMWAYE